jgi:hypothetical protein
MKNNEYHGDEHLLTDEERRNVFLDDFQRLSDRVDWLAKTSWLPDGDDQDALETLQFFMSIAVRERKNRL